MGIVNGIVTAIALVTFIGIVWWAYSRGRAKANAEAALLPFAQPDEEDEAATAENGVKQDSDGQEVNNKKQGGTHE